MRLRTKVIAEGDLQVNFVSLLSWNRRVLTFSEAAKPPLAFLAANG